MLRALARGSRDARRASRLGAAPCAGCSAVWPAASACAVHAASAHGGWPRCGEAVTRHGVSRGVCCGRVARVVACHSHWTLPVCEMCIRGGSWFSQKKSYAEARRDPERHFERETVKHCRTHFRDSTRRLRRGGARRVDRGRVRFIVTRQDAPRACHTWYECCILSTSPEGTCSAPGLLLPTADRGDRSAGWSVEQTGEPTRGTKRSVN